MIASYVISACIGICACIYDPPNPILSFVVPFGMTKHEFNALVGDNIITDDEREILYRNYYEPSPEIFISHATLYGSDEASIAELAFFGETLRQQMQRGFALNGSAMYGYRDSDKEFIGGDYLLDNQASKAYLYYADGIDMSKRDEHNQPIPITYCQLNDNQRRIYDITEYRNREIYDRFIVEDQSNMPEKAALDSGKYIGFVSTKSPNDLGRRFLLYSFKDEMQFVGVVLVTGMAKRADWTGLEKPTTDAFRYYNNPLVSRVSRGTHWGFDLTYRLYERFGGAGGPTGAIIAIDPDAEYSVK